MVRLLFLEGGAADRRLTGVERQTSWCLPVDDKSRFKSFEICDQGILHLYFMRTCVHSYHSTCKPVRICERDGPVDVIGVDMEDIPQVYQWCVCVCVYTCLCRGV